jgi:tripartite-type tricarboxylate transporter receptor subunit TctC
MNGDGRKVRFVFWAIVWAAALFPVFAAKAANWPAKPVRIIVPYAAGGNADIWARIISDPLSAAFGEQFYVENRGGAGGLIGSQAAAMAEPDGYTLLLSGIGSLVISPVMNQNSGIDTMRDFTHIAYLGGPPFVFVVHPSLGVKNFKDLISALKNRKDGVGYASPGPGTFGNLLAELLAKTDQLNLFNVPYKGAGPAMLDVIGGHVKIGCVTWTSAVAHIRAGSVIPLAVSSSERLADFPDVPTLKELGYPKLVATTWFGLSGPAGMPKDIVDRLNREVIKTLAEPRAQKQMEQEALLTRPMTPQQFTDFMQTEIDKWGPIAEQVGKNNR